MINGAFYTNNGSKEFSQILPEVEFPFPKPTELIQFILSLFERNDLLVLNSFAGSGSTAQGVMEANKRDDGSRRFILVEMEDYADKLTAERIRRVIRGYAFKGTQRTELLREKLSWRTLQRAADFAHRVEGIENLHGHEFDRIKKEVSDGEFIVVGEKAVTEYAEGLGGSFTYCALGASIELDKILTGESLPGFASIGSVLFHMATNRVADPS